MKSHHPQTIPSWLLIAIRLLFVLLFVFITIYWAGSWAEREVETYFDEQERSEALMLANVQVETIERLMMHGEATYTLDWFRKLDEIAGIYDASVYRRDGTPAFSDLKTLNEVNQYLGNPQFQREPHETSAVSERDALSIAEAAKGESVVLYRGVGQRSLFIPIENHEACGKCHGYDANPVRGVYHVRLSTWSAQSRMAALRENSLFPAATFLFFYILL